VGERLGNQVVDFDHVTKSFGDRVLIDDLSFKIPPGAIVGIIGPNGAGKTTLFKLITGKEQPDSGKITIGHTAQVGVVDQSREALPDDKTAWEAISGGLDILTIGKFEIPSRAYLGRFNFKGGDQQKNVGQLSGGERGGCTSRRRCSPARTCCCSTSRATTSTSRRCARSRTRCQEFPGTVLVISHDRWFLDRIATHILAAEDDSKWVFVEGNYRDYEDDKIKRPRRGRREAAPPRYKPLMQ
jgi:sulfate-transporting ATPase